MATANPSPEAIRASDKKYTQFWWKLMFELGVLAMLGTYLAFAGN